jgi:pimeloyl-ACP methyl ester carboxylesterase
MSKQILTGGTIVIGSIQALPADSQYQRDAGGHSHPHSERTIHIRTSSGGIGARIFVPAVVNSARRPLIALHGISRKDKAIFAGFKDVAAKTGRILIVPRFSRKDWPEFQRIGRARPDRAILGLLSVLRDEGIIASGKIDLFGFSGGAQLANRFALLYPQMVSKLHLAAAGWYCMPDQEIPFPVGIGTAKKPRRHGAADIDAAMRAQIGQFLRIPLRLYVGEEDTLRDAALRTTAIVDRSQGLDRKSRAAAFLASFREAAGRLGIAPNISMAILAGCGHDFTQCAQEAALAERVSF